MKRKRQPISKPKPVKNNEVPPNKVAYCTNCGTEHRTVTVICKKCKAENAIVTFDSMMEGLRFRALFDDSTITHLSAQFKWDFGIPKAKFELPIGLHGVGAEPIFKGWDCKNISKRLGYKLDFKYYDSKGSGWTLEEFKPTEFAAEDAKVKLNLLYDQVFPYYAVCYSYPEKNIITVDGKDVYQQYKRKFLVRTKGDKPRYIDFDAYQNYNHRTGSYD